MLGVLVLAAFVIMLVGSVRILRVARPGVNKGVLLHVSGCLNYRTAIVVGLLGFAVACTYLWTVLMGAVCAVVMQP